jgi:hypothetical protein
MKINDATPNAKSPGGTSSSILPDRREMATDNRITGKNVNENQTMTRQKVNERNASKRMTPHGPQSHFRCLMSNIVGTFLRAKIRSRSFCSIVHFNPKPQWYEYNAIFTSHLFNP